MKNIDELLKEAGIEMPEDKKADFAKAFGENYKTVADYDRQREKLKLAEDKAKTAEDGLKAFEGVDVANLKKQIADLTQSLKDKDAEHEKALSERDFMDALRGGIRDAKGKNEKAIIALLDLEELRRSTDRKEAIAKQIEAVKKDSDYLFEPDTPQPTGNKISVGRGITDPTKPIKRELKPVY